MALLPQVQTWTFRRAGSLDPNPTTFAQRSAAFASAATGRYNSVALIATRTEEGVQGYLVSGPWNGMNNAAVNLAHAVGAKVQRVPAPPQLLGPGREVVGRLEYKTGNSGGLIQAGADPTEVVKTLAQSMPMNSWVGATIRRPTRLEHNRWFDWLNTRHGGGQSHNTRQTNFPVISAIYAATSSQMATRTLLNQVGTRGTRATGTEMLRTPSRCAAARPTTSRTRSRAATSTMRSSTTAPVTRCSSVTGRGDRDTPGGAARGTYYLKNVIAGSDADVVLTFGRTRAAAMVGDGDGDGTLSLRRPDTITPAPDGSSLDAREAGDALDDIQVATDETRSPSLRTHAIN